MAESMVEYASLAEWAGRAATAFSLVDAGRFNAAVDQVIAALGDDVAVLGLGEGMHGGVDLLRLRNHLFQRLVEAHGYSAIAIESSYPRGRLANAYGAGRGPETFEALAERGFSHGFGRLAANRELIEWIKHYNAGRPTGEQLQFYGFDSPTEMWGSDSPRQLLTFVLDYLAAEAGASGGAYCARMEPLLGDDAAWENPAAMMDPAQSIGGSAAAGALRLVVEDLIADLRARRPELAVLGDAGRYEEALHDAELARQLLTYHAGVAQAADDRTARLLGQRDAMMADNLVYIAARERAAGRGKVLAFAHNSHVQRGQAQWQLGLDDLRWWPAGAHLAAMLGPRYAVIGTGLVAAAAHGLGQPEAGTLEARLAAAPGPGRLIATHRGQGLPAAEAAALPTRAGSQQNTSYFPLTARSLTDFDWLAVLDSTE